MRHLSCPRDWKSSSDDPASWSSWKNFNESFPVGPSWPTGCVEIHRSHSLMIKILASLCFIGTHSQPRSPWVLSDRAGQTVRKGASAAAHQHTLPGLTINKLLNKSSSLCFLIPPAIRCICAAVCPSNRPNFDADSAESPATAWLGGVCARDVSHGERVSSDQWEAALQRVVCSRGCGLGRRRYRTGVARRGECQASGTRRQVIRYRPAKRRRTEIA